MLSQGFSAMVEFSGACHKEEERHIREEEEEEEQQEEHQEEEEVWENGEGGKHIRDGGRDDVTSRGHRATPPLRRIRSSAYTRVRLKDPAGFLVSNDIISTVFAALSNLYGG